MAMRKYFCTFPQHLISEPIISHTLGLKFGVIPNIRAASINDTLALVAVEIEGEENATSARSPTSASAGSRSRRCRTTSRRRGERESGEGARVRPAALALALAAGVAACRSAGPAGGRTLERGMVVAEHPLAAEAGARVLELGGNAADAAVATALALAVTYPQAGNLGGGGFAVWCSSGGERLSLDFRETAPRTADAARLFDERGEPLGDLLLWSPLGVGVPGSPAGLFELHRRCGSGRIGWSDLCLPAIELAERGFRVDAHLARSLRDPEDRARLERSPGARELFYPGGEPLREGDRLVQRELAATLRACAERGPDAFYEGEIARATVAELDATAAALPEGDRWDSGWIGLEDLGSYEAKWREPIIATWRGREIVTMPPPSSGGIVLVQALRTLDELAQAEGAATRSMDARSVHWTIETLRCAFRERAERMGDPDFVAVPVDELLSSEWIERTVAGIGERAAESDGRPPASEGANTTHLSVVDADGNAVALTTTLNSTFGSGILVRGGGFLLNDELDDFALGGGIANQFGLVGGDANAIRPGKRPLSSMTPTIVRRGGRVELVLGSPGGPRIITAVLEVLLRVVADGEPLAAAVAAPRYHQQWRPGTTRFEPGWPEELLEDLRARGHDVEVAKSRWGSVQAIRVDAGGGVEGASDPRSGGACAATRAR
jgi:gamma-glutamyltranspeptidase / glutathione hydrolase